MVNTVLNCQPDVPVVIKVHLHYSFYKIPNLGLRGQIFQIPNFKWKKLWSSALFLNPTTTCYHEFEHDWHYEVATCRNMGVRKYNFWIFKKNIKFRPLLTSKSPMRGLNTSQSTQGLRSHSSTLSEADRIHGLHGRMKPSASLSNAKLMQGEN